MTEQAVSKLPSIRFKGLEGEWEKKTLGSICTVGDVDHWMPETTSYGIPYVMTGDFYGINEIDFENAKLISEADFEKLTKKIKPELGDILFARYASVGAVRYIRTTRKFVVSYSCAILKYGNSFNSEYLFFLLQSDKIQNRLKESINTGSQGNIGTESLRQLICRFPKITEQTQIGTYFRELDSLINLHQRKHDKLLTLKKAMLQKMFPQAGAATPEIRFGGFSGDWKVKKLGDIFSYERPDQYIVRSSKYSNDYTIPVLTANKAFILGYTNETRTFNKPCIVFDDFTLEAKFVEFPFMVKSSAIKLLTIQDTPIDDLYFAFLTLNNTRLEIMGHARHYISVVQPTLTRAPKLDEQQIIGSYFRTLNELISKHAIQLQKLKQIKSACLERMFV